MALKFLASAQPRFWWIAALVIALVGSGCALDDPKYGIPALRNTYPQTGIMGPSGQVAPGQVAVDIENGNYEAAIKDESSFIGDDPTAYEYSFRGYLYATNGQYDLALRDLNAAIAKDSKASLLDTLAAAYARAGQYDQAVKWEKQALRVLAGRGSSKSYEARLALYQSGKPYTQTSLFEGSRNLSTGPTVERR